MKLIIYSAAFALFLGSCESQISEKQSDKSVANTSHSIPSEKIPDHDPSFINELSESNNQAKLVDNYILIGEEKVYFPEDLQLNKETIFQGNREGNKFVLTLTRINLTSLIYDFKVLDSASNLINGKSGKATISPQFFLDSEIDSDDAGDSYSSTAYWDYSSDCSFAIRLGEKDKNGTIRAKVLVECENDKDSKNIDLDVCPTLKTE